MFDEGVTRAKQILQEFLNDVQSVACLRFFRSFWVKNLSSSSPFLIASINWAVWIISIHIANSVTNEKQKLFEHGTAFSKTILIYNYERRKDKLN